MILDKGPKATFFGGKLLKAKNITLDTATVIKDIEPEESYKYLGVTEGDGMQHSSMRELNPDWILKFVKKHEQNKRMYSITSDAKKIFK